MKKMYLIGFLIISLLLIGCEGNNINVNTVDIQKTYLEQFENKPTILLWGSTGCPHCVSAMPIFEKDVYEKYTNKINIQINVLSEDEFETSIPQVLDSPLTFEGVSSIECGFIPSWIILDKDLNVVEKSCGNEKTIEDIKLSLNILLK